MKGTKKRFAALAMALVLMVMLVACGSSRAAAGVYNLTDMELEGTMINLKEFNESTGGDLQAVLTLGEDGNFTLEMSALGTSQNMAGTWKEDGKDLILTVDGSDEVATLEGTKLTMEEDGDTLVFEKSTENAE